MAQLYIYDFVEQKSYLTTNLPVYSDHTRDNKALWLSDNLTIIFPATSSMNNDQKTSQNSLSQTDEECNEITIYKQVQEKDIYTNVESYSFNIVSANIVTRQHAVLLPKSSTSQPYKFITSSCGNWISYFSLPRTTNTTHREMVALWLMQKDGYFEPKLIDNDIDVSNANFNLPWIWHLKQSKLFYIKQGCLYQINTKDPTLSPYKLTVSNKFLLNSRHFQLTGEGNLIVAADISLQAEETKVLLVINLDTEQLIAIIDLNNYSDYKSINYVWQSENKLIIVLAT